MKLIVFLKITKIDIPLARIMKKKMTKINKIRNETLMPQKYKGL